MAILAIVLLANQAGEATILFFGSLQMPLVAFRWQLISNRAMFPPYRAGPHGKPDFFQIAG
jgi:hypothetical protein